MGIQKNIVQALVVDSIISGGPHAMYRVLYEHRIGDCDFVLYDHNILMYKAMRAYSAAAFNIDDFVNTLMKCYLKYTISSSSCIFMIKDGASFKLKVAARQRRAHAAPNPLFDSVKSNWSEIFERAYKRLCAHFRGGVVAVSGVDPERPERGYTVYGLQEDAFGECVRAILATPEVEADLVQIRLALGLARAYGEKRVGVVSIDTDLPMIASALVNVLGHQLPPNVAVFFQTRMLTSEDSMGGMCSRYKIEPRAHHKCVLDKLATAHGALEGSLKFLLDDEQPTPNELSTWAELCQHKEAVAAARAASVMGIRGALAKKWLDLAFYDGEKGLAVGRALGGKKSVKCVLEMLYGQELTAPVLRDAMCLVNGYKRRIFAFNTFGNYRRILDLEYVPLTPMPPTKRSYAAVVLAVLGGTDYNIPLHKMGLQQMLAALREINFTAAEIPPYHQFTGEYLARHFLPVFTKLTTKDKCNKVWDVCALLLKAVLDGWTTGGAFLELYNQVQLQQTHAGFQLQDGEIGFEITGDELGAWKSSISISRTGR